jgi:hypothetical protein
MNMNGDATQVVKAPDTSCCFLSGAPIPQSQYKTFELSTEMAAASLDQLIDSLRIRPLPLMPVAQSPSPPSLQSLHCIFLI